MQLANRHDIVFAGGVVRIEADGIGVAYQANIAPAKLAIGPGQMKSPAELLANNMDEKRLFAGRELIDAFCPKRDGEAEEEYGFDQDNGEFQMCRDAAFHSLVISSRMPVFPEAN